MSDLGRIRSVERTVRRPRNGTRIIPTRILKPQNAVNGRPVVYLSINGLQKSVPIHRIVATAFLGPRPVGMECCHGDGNKANNALNNLRYDTHASNEADKLAHGTHHRGERHWMSKLTEGQVIAIMGDMRPNRIVASGYGVTEHTIKKIRCGGSWGWLTSSISQGRW